MNADYQYLYLIDKILDEGERIQSRNSEVIRHTNLILTFKSTPLISIRKTAWKNALREMEWFLSGSNNIKDLHESVGKWWEPWANEKGYIFNNYSKQFRCFEGLNRDVDQIQYMIETLKHNPFSRRNVITTWNTADMTNPATPITNCHGTVIQAFVNNNDELSITMYQRSADILLGVPHNFIQYWAFLMYLAYKTNKKVGNFTWIGGDCHIYSDHIETAKNMLGTINTVQKFNTPELVYSPTNEEFRADDFTLDGKYKPIIKESLKMIV